jgi:hypothetical protein
MVNDKGHVFQVSNLNSSPMDVRRIASSKELTTKSDSFAMSFMNLSDEEHVVLAWADSSRATGWIKKIPAISRVCYIFNDQLTFQDTAQGRRLTCFRMKSHFAALDTPGLVYEASSFAEPRDIREQARPPAELANTEY